MSSKSYSTTTTEIINTPKTIGVQDQGILAEGGSTISLFDERIDNSQTITNNVEIDEDAVEKAFEFADNAFDRASDTTEKTMDLMGIISDNERINMGSALDFANATFLAGSNIMNDALHYKASEQALSNEDRADSRDVVKDIMSPADTKNQTLLYYGAVIGGLFILYKSMT